MLIVVDHDHYENKLNMISSDAWPSSSHIPLLLDIPYYQTSTINNNYTDQQL